MNPQRHLGIGLRALETISRLPAFRLIVVGAACTALYLAMAASLSLMLPSAALASLAAYVLAAFASYAAHRAYTFESKKKHKHTAWRFLALTAFGYVLSFSVPWLTTDRLGFAASFSFALVAVIVPIVNAILLSRFVFVRDLTVPLEASDRSGIAARKKLGLGSS